MRLTSRTKIIICFFAAALLTVAAVKIFSIHRSVQQTLAEKRARQAEQTRIPFEKKSLTPHLIQNVKFLQTQAATKDFIKFQNSYYAATGGGLVQYDDDGKIVRRYTVLDGLPESKLTSLAVFKDTLFIGTATKNLVGFDGKKFEGFTWKDRPAQAITALLATDNRLLIGTRDSGLIAFDGAKFTWLAAGEAKIAHIDFLYQDLSDDALYIGTFDNGLWVCRRDVWTQFTASEGLPSNRIVGVARQRNNLYAATDLGLAILQDKVFKSAAAVPTLAGLALYNDRLYLTKDDGEIFIYDNSLREFANLKDSQNTQFAAADGKLWLTSQNGITEIRDGQLKPFAARENNSLTDNFVSALAIDKRENLWVGTFRRGIDVFDSSGTKLRHLESDSLREINFLSANDAVVSAATTDGLISFKNDFKAENLTHKEGLPSNSVTQAAGNFIATAKGLALRENDRLRLFSTVQGLPNNSVYAALETGGKLYVGTLGGLAVIENNRVMRTFKDSNSNLSTNWVTALCAARGRLFIGTYGGGIFELLPSGEIRAYAAETGNFTVNPNALYSDGERLYAGTLSGVKILDLESGRWRTVKNIMPSETVLSVTGDDKNVYFGTSSGIAQIGQEVFANGEMEAE